MKRVLDFVIMGAVTAIFAIIALDADGTMLSSKFMTQWLISWYIAIGIYFAIERFQEDPGPYRDILTRIGEFVLIVILWPVAKAGMYFGSAQTMESGDNSVNIQAKGDLNVTIDESGDIHAGKYKVLTMRKWTNHKSTWDRHPDNQPSLKDDLKRNPLDD